MTEIPATPTWHKARASGTGDCVEVSMGEGSVLVRSSKDVHGPVLAFSLTEWAAFLHGVRSGEFDLPKLNRPPAPS